MPTYSFYNLLLKSPLYTAYVISTILDIWYKAYWIYSLNNYLLTIADHYLSFWSKKTKSSDLFFSIVDNYCNQKLRI